MKTRILTLALAALMAGGTYAQAQSLQADVTFPYAFRHDAGGISLDAGASEPSLGPGFIGAEWTYFGPTWTEHPPQGPVHLNQEIDALEAVYRYAFPLFEPAGPHHGYGPGFFYPSIEGYVGGGAGVGFVWERRHVYSEGPGQPGFSGADEDNGEFVGEVSAGLLFDLMPGFSFRLGDRYLGFSQAKLFGGKEAVSTNAIEVGFSFRF